MFSYKHPYHENTLEHHRRHDHNRRQLLDDPAPLMKRMDYYRSNHRTTHSVISICLVKLILL